MSRIVGQSAAVQAAVRQHYFEQQPSSQIIAPPIPPAVVPIAVGLMVEGTQHWHVIGDHHDPVMLASDSAAVGLFLVVIVLAGYRAIVQLVTRRLA